MKKLYLILVLFLNGCLWAEAQTVLRFSVKQLPAVVADAGQDTTLRKGEKVKIGGLLPASGGSGNYTYAWTPAKWLDKADVANPVASPDSTITYTLTVNDGQGCVQTSQVTLTVSAVTGIRDQAAASRLVIFPNPNPGTFLVTSQKQLSPQLVYLEVFDPLGKLVYADTIPAGRPVNKKVRLAPQAKGIFMLRLSNSTFNTLHKIIVQ